MKWNENEKYKYIRVVGIILFFYILSRINLQELFLILKNINLFYFFSAIILLPLPIILGILKWKILVNSQDIKISFKPLTEVFLKGFFLGTITPGKLGEFWRAKYLTDVISISGGKAFYTALIDRLIDVIIITMVGTVGVINLLLFNKIKTGWLIVTLLLISALFIFYFLIKKENTKKFLKFLLNFFVLPSAREKTNSFFDEFFKGMEQLNFVLFLKLISYGFIYYLISVLIYYFLALSLGITITFFYLFLIVAVVRLLLIVPITILGLGTREASYIFFFATLNIKAPLAVAFSTLILVITVILSIPGLILFLRDR